MAPRSRKPFQLGFDVAAYNPIGLRNVPTADLTREYARLRREATERLRKLGQSEFKTSTTYLYNKDRFLRVRDVPNRRTLERLVQEAARFVTARGSSASGLRGIRRDQINTLHAHGYTWINTKNFEQFTQFMEHLRSSHNEFAFYRPSADPEEHRDQVREMKEAFEEWRQQAG